jgi:glutamate--cysteine ligase
MNDYFPRVGGKGRRMMRQTASVQVTFDFKDERLGTELLRTAWFLAPFAAALFCNSPFVDGRATEYRSYRVPIWADTDPCRTGLLPGFAASDYGFGDYLQQVLAATMFFVRTDQGLVDAGGMTFDQFNRRGFQGRAATMDDFVLHNSTIFTDVRLKRTVEVRSVDGQDPGMLPAVVAFLSGLLLCSAARGRTLEVLGAIAPESYSALPLRLAREGLAGRLPPTAGGGPRPVRELAVELIETARAGLLNCFPDGKEAGSYLEPLRELAAQGLTPADRVLDRFADARRWLAAGTTFPTDARGRIVRL